MRLQIVSDLHLEFGPLQLSVDDTDVLIAAGDIGLGQDGLEWLFKYKRPVIYVAGNHEYWGQDLDYLPAALKAKSLGSRVHYLENRTVEIDGTRFIGCTLWTSMHNRDQGVISEISRSMNDFRYISKSLRPARPHDLVAIHYDSRAWLEKQLAKPYDGKTVVVTHHAPQMKSWFEGRDESIQYAYCNDLSSVMQKYDIDLWVHGHVHKASDYEAHGVHVVCNPRGYYKHKLVKDFDSEMIVTV